MAHGVSHVRIDRNPTFRVSALVRLSSPFLLHKQHKGGFKLEQLKMEADGSLPPWAKRRKSAIANLKLIQQAAATEKIGLYDLSKDTGEQNNLAGKHPQKVKEMPGRQVGWVLTQG